MVVDFFRQRRENIAFIKGFKKGKTKFSIVEDKRMKRNKKLQKCAGKGTLCLICPAKLEIFLFL